jgi:hypothetical protein
MNPIPQAPLDSPLLRNGYFDLPVLLIILSLLILFGVGVLSLRTSRRQGVRLFCPVRLRRVAVLFRLGRDGRRVDVERCSVFGRRPITCGKVCLHDEVPG